MTFFDRILRKNTPVTIGLVATLALSAIALAVVQKPGFETHRLENDLLSQPWVILTYPWSFHMLSSGFGLLFGISLLLWLFSAGSALEYEMGSKRFLVFWFVITLLGGAGIWLGAKVESIHVFLTEPFLPIAALTVAWSVRNKTQTLSVYGVIPVRAYVLGWLASILLVLSYGSTVPVLGLFATLPLIIAFCFASDLIPRLSFSGDPTARNRRRISPTEKELTTRGQVRYDQSYFDEVKRRELERLEKERLKQLLGED